MHQLHFPTHGSLEMPFIPLRNFSLFAVCWVILSGFVRVCQKALSVLIEMITCFSLLHIDHVTLTPFLGGGLLLHWWLTLLAPPRLWAGVASRLRPGFRVAAHSRGPRVPSDLGPASLRPTHLPFILPRACSPNKPVLTGEPSFLFHPQAVSLFV